MSRKSTNKIAIGALIGACVGYIAGVFTAPKSGKENRALLKNKAERTIKNNEQKLKKMITDLDALIKKGNEQAKRTKESTKQGFTKAVDKARKAKQKIRELISAIHEGEAGDKDLSRAVNEGKKAVEHLKKFIRKDANK